MKASVLVIAAAAALAASAAYAQSGADVLKSKASPTGQFLSGQRSIAMPKQRRNGTGKLLTEIPEELLLSAGVPSRVVGRTGRADDESPASFGSGRSSSDFLPGPS